MRYEIRTDGHGWRIVVTHDTGRAVAIHGFASEAEALAFLARVKARANPRSHVAQEQLAPGEQESGGDSE